MITSLNPEDDERAAISKKISWILRHGTVKVGLRLNDDGYALLDDVLKLEILDNISKEKLLDVIKESNLQKPRYEVKDSDQDGQMIKALSNADRKAVSISGRSSAAASVPRDAAPGTSTLRQEAQAFVPAQMNPQMNPQINPYAVAAMGGFPPMYPGYPWPVSPMARPPWPYPMAPFGMPAMPPPVAPTTPATGRYRGRVKSFNAEKGFGFIDCPEAHAKYGRDVFLHKANVGDMTIGAEVEFAVETNKQNMPQVRDLVVLSEGPGMVKGDKGKGKGGKGKGKGKGKGASKKDGGEEGGGEEGGTRKVTDETENGS